MQNKLLYVSSFLILLSLSFTFNESQIKWMWEDYVPVAIVLLSSAFIGMVIYSIKRIQGALN